ncbi:MAG: Paraquat-inducible protein [Myxococcales bacterium]|nr:Paraquat-inducible protein [Myxococcales bacterium]
MSAHSRHWKIGILAVVAIAAAVIAATALGLRARTPTVTYHTYFDESVQGLEVGSAVKFRGLPLGIVSGISLGPDDRLIDVAMAIDRDQAHLLRFARTRQLRARLATQGITGVRFIDVDFFDPAKSPPPKLSFEPDPHYIPSKPSFLKALEDRAESVGESLARLAEHGDVALASLESVLRSVRDTHLPDRVATAVVAVGNAATEIRTEVRKLDRETVSKIDRVIDRIDGEHGLVSSAQSTVDELGALGRSARDSTEDLEQTIHDVGDVARSLRDLVDEIDREPDMLVKGRARTKHR